MEGDVNLRNWLKNLRKEKGWTQEEVSKKLEIAPSYYVMIENGQRQNKMTFEMGKKIATTFNVPFDWVVEQETK